MRTGEKHGIEAALGETVVSSSVLAGGFSHETSLLAPAGHVVADQAAEKVRLWVRHGVPDAI